MADVHSPAIHIEYLSWMNSIHQFNQGFAFSHHFWWISLVLISGYIAQMGEWDFCNSFPASFLGRDVLFLEKKMEAKWLRS